jgi:hypothetical protein
MRPYEVIIPVRNGGLALTNSIQSLLPALAAGRVSLTISDNFSTDGSPWRKQLEALPAAQWRLIQPPAPLGRVEHWSWAFAQGRSPWIKPLMAADCVDTGFWDWADETVARFPAVGFLFCGLAIFDPGRAHPESKREISSTEITTLYELAEFSRDAVRCQNSPGALTQVMVRADVLTRALPFDPQYAWTADWRFYHRCLQQAPAAGTRTRWVCQDRSIARFSTSWNGLIGSVREEWQFASMQAAVAGVSPLKALGARCKASGFKLTMLLGRKMLPRWLRRGLTSVTGLHKPTSAK